MVVRNSILALWIISFAYAAPAVVTIIQTQYATVVANSPANAANFGAPLAGTVATSVTQAGAAPVAAPTQAATAAAPAAASSSGFSLSSFLNSDFLNRWLSYFNLGGYTSTSSSAASANTVVAQSAVTPTFATYASPSSSTKQPTSAPSSAPSSVPNGNIYAEMAKDSRVDMTWGKAMLDAHNKYRAIHQVGDLSWSDAAYKYAQNVADSYDCLGILTHTHGPYGENLSCGYGKDTTGLDAWYEEVKDYNWQTQNTYDHFTQMVWKSSTQVGCAYKDCRANNWGYYAICSYNPPGNFVGQNAQNVFPATS